MTGLVAKAKAVVILTLLVVGGVEAVREDSEWSGPLTPCTPGLPAPSPGRRSPHMALDQARSLKHHLPCEGVEVSGCVLLDFPHGEVPQCEWL